MLTQTPFDVVRRPSFLALWSAAALLLCAGGLLLSPAANAQQNSPSPLAGEGRGEGATNNVSFDIPAQDLSDALSEYARQSGQDLLYRPEQASGRAAAAVEGSMTRAEAMRRLLAGTGLQFEFHHTGSMLVGDQATLEAYRQQLNSGASVAGQNTIGQRRPGIEEIIVTGQKKEERIQDVPIAISAFTQEDLKTSQIAGGPDLHLQVPNMTFTKTNFTGYSIQIRGIGTQAISATTDPAVAVALNNTPFIRNSFFEQEFYDLERLEVLRGPQGTLYGRNATAGVVNLITAKPKFQEESMFSLDMGNYNSRRWEFMVNKPLVDDQVALRIAGAGTKRDGYATNELTENPIDGRDLWSGRVSLRFAPTNGNFDLNLIYEHFEEDDDRLRSGKQLCTKDVVTEVGGIPVDFNSTAVAGGQSGALFAGVQATLSQGCKRGSLYSENAFQTPNGLMLPYYLPLSAVGLPGAINGSPYVDANQSRDLRVIESVVDPEYRASSDIGQIQLSYQLTDTLTLDSETAYSSHSVFSLEDFNRFNTAPGAWQETTNRENLLNDGVFCDPQLGCSDRLVVVDISEAESTQFSQEFRLSSQFTGPFDFSLGANFLRYDNEDKFYVLSNSFTLAAARMGGGGLFPWVPGESDNSGCLIEGFLPHDPTTLAPVGEGSCQYIDPNPIGSLNDRGHNYFLSKNPYKLVSYAIFGESYYRITDNLKLTAGLRWSVDEKEAPRIPSQLFAGESVGHPTAETIEQTWREPTGRLVLDWKPNLGFTDETLLYGSYSHGYKAGGANPPILRFATRGQRDIAENLNQKSATKPKTFDAEFVDAFEVGTKNTLADGALTFNLTGFYYDYEDYQISEIVDRSAFNQNYDAEVWGAELETDWWALENFRLGLKLGYQKTRIADGEQAVDLMDRTAGTEGWLIARPFPTFPSSCVLPEYVFFDDAENPTGLTAVGGVGGGGPGACDMAYAEGVDPVTRLPYVPNPTVQLSDVIQPGEGIAFSTLGGHDNYPGFDPASAPNNGEGFFKDLGGNELPNAPNWTATVTADYVIPLKGDWLATLHTDIYWQSESWWRIFNDHEYNRLEPYFTMNLAAIFTNEVSGWDIMAYVKNVTDEDALTGAFLYSDDVGLTTNTFLVEPRTAGIRVTKHWDGGGPAEWLGGAGAALLGKEPGEPSPWELTVGGYLLRPSETSAEIFAPTFITEFDPSLDLTGEQHGRMDWGDGREIELTYAPDNGWRFSLGARFGESGRAIRKDVVGETVSACRAKYDACQPGGYEPDQPFLPPNYPALYSTSEERTNYSLTDVTEVEEHLLVDFTVGRDVGLGALEGTASVGLRYANFQSKTDAMLRGTPDWQPPYECWAEVCADFSNFPPVFTFYANPGTHNEYRAEVKAEREFKGVGPVVGWEASNRLLGDDNGGHLDLDWKLSGGVLFGKQTTTVEGVEESQYFSQTYNEMRNERDSQPDDASSTPIRVERDDDGIEVVPTLGAEVGLTYRLEGASIGLGYTWERYYSVIDGGVEERKLYDRTIDGPYLKVTFGGGS